MPMDNFPPSLLEIRGTISLNFDENHLPLYKAVQREKFMFFVTAIRGGSVPSVTGNSMSVYEPT